ncbi:MAG: helix-turn-helix domain-containing protein [Macromonas sp.]
MSVVPRSLFFTSPSQRTAFARQTYFEDGHLPSGMVGGAILESWARCCRLQLNPAASLDFRCASLSRIQLALQRNQALLDAWNTEHPHLERTLAGTACSAILTDASGLLIATTGHGNAQAVIIPQAHRIGVHLSEECAGTTAPGLVLKTGKVATVLGGEHFFASVMPMHCTAAPIYNTRGQLAGVLNISSEGHPFAFDMNALVALYATAVENRLLCAQSLEHWVVRLQVNPVWLDTPMAGMAGVDGQGKVVWMNPTAASLLGYNRTTLAHHPPEVEAVFGHTLSILMGLPRQTAIAIKLPNGLSVWVRGTLQVADGIDQQRLSHPTTVMAEATAHPTQTPESAIAPAPPPLAPPTASLRESEHDLVRHTVQAFGGNISKAAQQLGVSRGLIYRRMKATPQRRSD